MLKITEVKMLKVAGRGQRTSALELGDCIIYFRERREPENSRGLFEFTLTD
jgi:hypothetical protein